MCPALSTVFFSWLELFARTAEASLPRFGFFFQFIVDFHIIVFLCFRHMAVIQFLQLFTDSIHSVHGPQMTCLACVGNLRFLVILAMNDGCCEVKSKKWKSVVQTLLRNNNLKTSHVFRSPFTKATVVEFLCYTKVLCQQPSCVLCLKIPSNWKLSLS